VYDPNAGPEGNNVNRSERGERGRGRGKQRGGRNDRTEYRQRSPPRRQSSPPRNAYGNARIPKVVEWDDTLPRDHIRVLSRTLFVGGAGGTEGEIREIFGRFGIVQTCIVNLEKRHAFVKMLTRVDAVSAKQGMDNLQDPSAQSKARQVCISFAYT
jgi:protein NRD1